MTDVVPTALRLLAGEKNLAVGAAIVDALPDMTPPAQREALRVLAERDHRPSLSAIVGRFLEYDESLQSLLTRQVADLFTGVSGAIVSASLDSRRSAVEFIAASGNTKLAYLLAEALRGKCPRTRESAASVLRRMTAEWLRRSDGRTALDATSPMGFSPRPRFNATAAEDLADALRKAVRSWEVHVQPAALEASMWMAAQVEPTIRERLAEPRGHFAVAVNDVLQGAIDPRLAGFVIRGLTIPAVRSAAARAIIRAHTPPMIEALARESWVLLDPPAAKGFRRVRECAWLHENAAAVVALPDSLAEAGVRMLTASGGSAERKYERLRDLYQSAKPALQRATLWHLLRDDSELSTHLLSAIATRDPAELAALARREVERRERRLAAPRESTVDAGAPPTEPATEASTVFDRVWRSAEQESPRIDAAAVRVPETDLPAFLVSLQAKLSAAASGDRRRALVIVDAMGLHALLEEQVYEAAHDADPGVRSRAVGLLAKLPTPTSLRILRTAVNDADERVQANAVEALDRLDAADRAAWTSPKLSSRSGRVRANAVKSLLRLDLRRAGETLLDMLGDVDQSHRLSALWVVERLRLKSLLERVMELGRHDPDERVRQRAVRLLKAFSQGNSTTTTVERRSTAEVGTSVPGTRT